MNLPHELYESIRLLLDKPCSPMVFKKLLSLIQNDSTPLQKCIALFCSKHRAELLIESLRQKNLALQAELEILNSVQGEILHYKQEELAEIWQTVLSRTDISFQQKISYGFSLIVQQGFKVTNLAVKDKLFELAMANVKYLWGSGEKKIIAMACKEFIALFMVLTLRIMQKITMNVPGFVAMLSTLLTIDQDVQNNQNSDNKDEKKKLGCFTQEVCSTLLRKITGMLEEIANKQNYSLQKQCLKISGLLCKTGEIQSNESGRLLKILECYNLKKPVRQESRVAYSLCKKAYDEKIGQFKQKMQLERQERPGSEKIVLIENVIERANHYRQKYQIERIGTSQGFAMSKGRFLKAGQGYGGGKSSLQVDSISKSQLKGGYKSQLDAMIDQCFSRQKHSLQQQEERQQSGLEDNPLKVMTQLSQYNNREEYSATISEQDWQNDKEIEEISNLIDLAFEYKYYAND